MLQARLAIAAVVTGLLTYACGSKGLHAQYSQSFFAKPDQKFGIELDSADKRRSEWFKDDLRSFSAFRAQCWVLRIGSSDRGAAFGFRVYFAESPQQKNIGYGLQLSTDSENSPIGMDIRYWDVSEKKDVVLKRFQRSISINEPFSVELIWTDQKLRVAVSQTESGEVSIPQPVSKFYISAATGDLRCQDAVLGAARF